MSWYGQTAIAASVEVTGKGFRHGDAIVSAMLRTGLAGKILGCQQIPGCQPIGRGSAWVCLRPVRVLSGGSGDGWALSLLIGV
jgi:hypothetical protein